MNFDMKIDYYLECLKYIIRGNFAFRNGPNFFIKNDKQKSTEYCCDDSI